MTSKTVNVVCVKWGDRYTYEHVNRLFKMVKRNLLIPFTFYCLTEDPQNLHSEIVPVALDDDLCLEGFWWKMCMFQRSMYKKDLPTLYFDIDTIIQKDITLLFDNFQEDKIRIPYMGKYPGRDAYKHPSIVNSSIMLFRPSKAEKIFNSFIENSDYNIIEYRGVCRYLTAKHYDDMVYYNYLEHFYSIFIIPYVASLRPELLEKHEKYLKVAKGSWKYYHFKDTPVGMMNGSSREGVIDQLYEKFSSYYD